MQSNKHSTFERRSNLRIAAELRVYYGDCQSKLLTGYSVDLSAGGVFLVTTCPFDVDDLVKLKLSLPGEEGETVICDARVAWINYDGKRLKSEYPAGVGLEFVNIAQDNLSSIVNFLEIKATW